MVEDLFAAGFI